MNLRTPELIEALTAKQQAPCLSLYMPTHRSYPANVEDKIRYKHMIKELEVSLLLKYAGPDVRKHLEPLELLANDAVFWNHTALGLAVFSCQNVFEVMCLQEPVDSLAVVADSFHTKPLRQYLQSLDRFHVLALGLHNIRLFEGNRHGVIEIDLSARMSSYTVTDRGEELIEAQGTVGAHSGKGKGQTAMHHGHTSGSTESEKDAERYFRLVANEIEENYSKPTGWPLILAAPGEHRSLFCKVNKNPLLLSEGITINPAFVSLETIGQMAWEIMEPEYSRNLNQLSERYSQSKANGKGSDDYKEVAMAAVEGRVDTLLIEANHAIAARITNTANGHTQKRDLQDPKVDDLTDDMGELVIRMGGHVMVMPAEKMPTDSGLAAIYRY